MFPRTFATLVLLAIPLPSFAANQVLTVGDGKTYWSLQTAVNAASEGDVILVGEGHFPTVGVVGKGVTIIADDPSNTGFHRIGALTISNLAAGQTVVVRGFEFGELVANYFGSRIDIQSCAGTVVIEDCQVYKGGPTVRVNQSSAALFVRTVIEGAIGNGPQHFPGQTALAANASNVFVYDSILEGGEGAIDFIPNGQLYANLPTNGGVGAVVVGGAFFSSGTLISGGDGGDLTSATTIFVFPEAIAANGGNAMRLEGGATWRRLQSPLIPGAAGISLFPNHDSGVPGIPLDLVDGSVLVVNEFARRLEVSSPIREGETQTMTATGSPNEPVWLLVSLGANAFYAPSLKGALLPALPLTVLSLGNLDAAGKLAASFPIQPGLMPPGIQGVVIEEQAMFAGSSGPIVLSSPTVAVLLDDSL